jgi:PAS domain-containing protein
MNSFRRPARIHGHVGVPAICVVAPERARRAMWLWPALLLGASLIALASNAHATLYKWTDERGIVHYSDQLPADAINRASFQLNRQGLTIKKTDQARPVVQRIPKTENDAQLLRQAERDRLLATRRDRALLESYTSENEIDLAKSRAVATIDGQVQSAQAFIAQMQGRRDELESKKATYSPRPVPGSIQREIETIDGEVARQNEFVAAKQKESASVAARYDADKQRFRELRSGEPTGSVVTADDGRFSAADPAALRLTSAPAAKP